MDVFNWKMFDSHNLQKNLTGYFVTWSCVPCLKQEPYFAKDISLDMYDNDRWHKHTWN